MKIQHYTAIAIKFIALLLFLNALRLALVLFQEPATDSKLTNQTD